MLRVLYLVSKENSLDLSSRAYSMAFLRRLVKGSDKKEPVESMDQKMTANDPLQDVTSKTADLTLADDAKYGVATFALS